MANMAIEAGGKNGIFEPDETTLAYVKARAKRSYKIYRSDPDAHYAGLREYDASNIFPQVSLPHIPSNAKDVRTIGKIEIDQVIIGSCTNGHLDDLRVAAKILRGKKVAPSVRMIVIPATPTIYRQALKEKLFDVFLSAGAVVSPPTCGPCWEDIWAFSGRGRESRCHNQSKFSRENGTCQERGLSGRSCGGCSQCCEGTDLSPRGSG